MYLFIYFLIFSGLAPRKSQNYCIRNMASKWQLIPKMSSVVIILLQIAVYTLAQQDFSNEQSRFNQDPFNRPTQQSAFNEIDRQTSVAPPFGNSIENANPNFPSGTTFSRDRERDRDRDRDRDRNRLVPPTSRRGPFVPRNNFLDDPNRRLINGATYFIVASRMVRPNQIYKVFVSVSIDNEFPIIVRGSISRDGVEMSADQKSVRSGVTETLLMRVPPTSVPGEYKLRVEGEYEGIYGGIAFINETKLTFSQRSMTIFIQTDKPVYKQSDNVRFRIIPITTELKGFDNAVDVYMLDPNRHIMRRWLSRQSNLGTVSLEYHLSDQPVYGEWTVRVVAQGQTEESKFLVEEYYQTRFEVNVTMPAFFFNTDPYIYGKVMANFTSGAPVHGNLTLKATIRPINWFDYHGINKQFRVWNQGYQSEEDKKNPYLLNRNSNNLYNTNNNDIYNYGPTVDQTVDPRYSGNTISYQDQYLIETHLFFDEEWPFWVEKPEYGQYDRWGTSDRWSNNNDKNMLPYLRYFNGTYEFRYPMQELEKLVPNLSNMEILITATVGERFYDDIIQGYSMARIYNSSIKVSFMGGTPQVFKPTMPFTCYVVAEYHDGSKLPFNDYFQGIVEVSGSVDSRSGGRRDFPSRPLKMSETNGVWELKIDLHSDLNLDETRNGREYLNDVQSMRLTANYIDSTGDRVSSDILLIAHQSPQNQHIKISTSTSHAKVGEYIVLHIESNFFMEEFHYLVISKGTILLTGQESIRHGLKTMSLTLSAEMAPVATIVVWHVGQFGQVVADTLTFPVNGISRNNFTVYINNRKHRTGERVEVAIYGEPGAYVGLSGIDNAFYTMQAGNELTYAKIISKMSAFDEATNGTFKHTWYSHEGNPDELVYYPSSTFGIDVNRTFEYVGLVVFTDAIIYRRPENCNASYGYGECLNGRCYRLDKKCDGFADCEDLTDELNCDFHNHTSLAEFRKYRFSRVQRHYENVWLWKDVNIGPHGRYVLQMDVPDIPALWMVSAFSISPSLGFGMATKPIEYVGCQPFYINVEMPTECRQGEQVGIRVSVFNYMVTAVEATVVLHNSMDYKFVHVEEDGIVTSYNPRTSFGEHQFFIYIDAQGSSVVYLPIVPQRLGDIKVKVSASTLLGSDHITRNLHVEADGLPQLRHQSMLMDLSSRAYIFHYLHVNVTETPIIPYEVQRYYVYSSNKAKVSIVGDVVGPIFPTMPVNASSLLYLPMDSAEQNMFSFAANLYTIMYMRFINQRNKQLEKEAFTHLNIGYQKQLSYLMPDGSFSLFRSDWNQSASSVWLTAYCARVFQEASFYEWENFIYIDPIVIQKNIAWLLRHQTIEGSFYEVTWSPDRKVNVSSHYEYPYKGDFNRNISLTAHVLVTLSTVKDLSGGLGAKVSLAQQKAVYWLERNLPLLKDYGTPYEIAVTAYALMLTKASKAEQAFNMLAARRRNIGELSYWGNEEVPLPPTKTENQKPFQLPRLPYLFDSLNIETTSYALLTYVSRQELLVDSIVRWLNAQRLTDGGWASTQDTGMAMKALIEYTIRSRIRDVSQLAVTVEATSLPGESKMLYIDDTNWGRLQSIEVCQKCVKEGIY
jgi:CD109 antigen